MILKTRDILVDVARTLFATKGFANTTMNDIANASNKGRRTLYTYFKNKDEVFYAVILQETVRLREKFKYLALSGEKKTVDRLVDYVYQRMEAVKNVVVRNGGLEAEFFQDQNVVERVRHRLDFNERNYLRMIFDEGVKRGEIALADSNFAALMLQSALKGMELPYIRGELAISMITKKDVLYNFLAHGLGVNQQ